MTRAHKREVTELDLVAMRQDLLDFNRTKQVFVDPTKNGLPNDEDHFHGIPKIHSLTHYPFLICQLGAPEGFSTEITERLHIDFVKKPWATTNHVNATQQMIAYLENREAWALLRAYMHDTGLVSDPRWKGAEAEDEEDSEEETDDAIGDNGDHGGGADGVWQPAPTVGIAKRPSHGVRVKGSYIINELQVTDLIPATIQYLRSLHPTRAFFPISHNSVFKAWKRCQLLHRPLPFDPALGQQTDQVRAFNTSRDSEGRVLRGGYFDVVLYQPLAAHVDQQGLH
ncbi:hypothetical protein FRC06_009883, partial [Ceratobasidium sp. 370]